MDNCSNQENKDKTLSVGEQSKESREEDNASAQADTNPHAPKDPAIVRVTTMNPVNDDVKKADAKLKDFEYLPNVDGEFEGLPVLGPYKYENGATYLGQYKEGKRHGRGRLVWPDGSVYVGYWKDDHSNIRGRMIHSEGDWYEGDWLDDKAEGKGIYTHADGTVYQGDWANDLQNGQGVERWPDQTVYEGGYKDGLKHGKILMVDG